ncbi:MAG: RNB domain-containing ribonuclease, partial [Candidatus Gracilibacteria bacterium]|nr:RNB domain-containing ribonuclease [Candidatus Gracilibacteria bacterium]
MYKKTDSKQGGFSPLKKKSYGNKSYGNKAFVKKPRDVAPEDTISGIYSQMDGKEFGFVDVEGEEKGYFVIERNRNGAFHGDEVLAEKKMFNGKIEADIFKIEKRATKNVVGTVQMKQGAGFAFIVPNGKMFKSDIFIPGKDLKNSENKDIVNVEITDFEGKNPRGRVIDILGKKGDIGIDVNSYIAETGFSQKFDEKLISDLEKKYSNKTPHLTKEGQGVVGRKDFKEIFTYTIDGEDAKDLDDAISIKKKENGSYSLYIHIADVAEYVEENSSLDKEAIRRATSVYLADRVIPMLPEILSNNLCSL